MRTKIIATVIFLSILSIMFVFMQAIRLAKKGFNGNRLALIQCAIGDAYLCGRSNHLEIVDYIRSKENMIATTTNSILDYFGNPVKYTIRQEGASTFFGVYSAGSDGRWGTQDDVRREMIYVQQDEERN